MILKQSLKNFLKGLKYVFTPIGILSVFIIIGFSIMIPSIVNAITTMFNNVAQEISSMSTDAPSVFTSLMLFIVNLNWSNPVTILSDLTNVDYITSALQTFLRDSFPGIDTHLAAIGGFIKICVGEIFKSLIIFVVIVLIGFILGYFVTRWLVRRDITHRKWYQAILFSIIDVIILVGAVYLGFLSFMNFGNNGVWFVILILFVMGIFALFEGWLIHGVKKVKLSKILNVKNLLFLLLGNLIIIVLGAAVIVLVSLMKMIVLTAILALAIIEVTQVVITANAEGYVRYLSNDVYNKEALKKLKKLEKEQDKESL